MPAGLRTAGGLRAKSPTTSRPIFAASRPPASAATRPSPKPNAGSRRSPRRVPYAEEMRGIAEAPARARRPSPFSMRAMSLPSPCSGRKRQERRAERSARDRARRLHHVRPRARGDRRSPHLARPELGLARRRAWAHLRAAGAAQGRTELRLPDRGRDRGRQDGRQRMRHRPGRERPGLEPRRPQSLSKAVPRALPGGARRGVLRRGGHGR